MKKNNLIQILNNVYSKDSVKSIVSGRRKPSLRNIVKFEMEYKIPASAWLDIKSYLQENDTPKKNNVQGNL